MSRDLARVTAKFAGYLDELPATLTSAYDCVVKEPSTEQRERIQRAGLAADESYVLAPNSAECASLIVGRGSYEGCTTVFLGLGRAVDEVVPSCFCDACGEDSASLIEQTDGLVQMAVRGLEEFRRPFHAEPGEVLYEGPWMQHGFTSGDHQSSRAGHDVRGQGFTQVWQPWPRRTPEVSGG